MCTKIVDRHITKGKPKAARFAVSTGVRCKSPEYGDIGSASCCYFVRLIRLLQKLRNCKVFNISVIMANIILLLKWNTSLTKAFRVFC